MKNLLSLMIMSLMIVSCGGSGGGSVSGGGGGGDVTTPVNYGLDSSVGTVNGVLLDDFVAGIYYTSTSNSGTTNASGELTCSAGEDVTFKVGTLVLGTVPCLPVITPIEIVTKGKHKWNAINHTGDDVDELSASENLKLKRLLMILQTVDTDGDPSNGVSVDANTVTALSSLSVDQTKLDSLLTKDSDSDFSDAMTSLATAMGGSTVAVTSATTAVNHFKTTLSSTTACTTADITGSSTVTGSTAKCTATACGTGYSLSNGSCVAKTACTTGDVSNSTAVTGYTEDNNCKATSCSAGYGLSSGACYAMTACTTGDVSNSTAVTGYVDNSTCQATACSSGYKVENGSCVVSTASQVVGDAIEFYNASGASTNGFFLDHIANTGECGVGNDTATLKANYRNYQASTYTLSSEEISCFDYMANEIKSFVVSNLNRSDDLIEVTGATDTSASFFSNNDSLSTEEHVIVDLMFDWHDAQ